MSAAVVSRIYQRNEWNGGETRSGPGSGADSTRLLVPALLQVVHWLGVHSVLDVGCGEGWWQPDLPGYVGLESWRPRRSRPPGATTPSASTGCTMGGARCPRPTSCSPAMPCST